MPLKQYSLPARLALLVALGLLIFAAIMQVLMAADGDKGWLLHATQKMLSGDRLYVEVMEINPPLILWLLHIPVLLGNLTGIDNAKVLVFIAMALVFVSISLCASLVRRHGAVANNPAIYMCILLGLAFVLLFWPNTIYFGDKEHLFVTLTLPYFFRFMPGIQANPPATRQRLLIGTMAALGFCIKPHFIVLFLTVQIMNLLFTRNWRIVFAPESWIIGAAWVFYLGCIFWFAPEYFSVMLPMAMETYGNYNNSFLITFFLYLPAIFSFLFAFAGIHWKRGTPYRRDCFYLMGLMAGAIVYINVNNGWLYTFFPLNSFVMLGVGCVWLDYLWLQSRTTDPKAAYNLKVARFFCLLVVLFNIIGTLIPFWLMFGGKFEPGTQEKMLSDLVAVMDKEKPESFGALSISSSYWPKIARHSHVLLKTRFQNLWPMPRFVLGDKNKTLKANESWVTLWIAEGLADDLQKHKPPIVFVDTSPHFGKTGKHFDLISFFSGNEKFHTAWQEYVLHKRISYCGNPTPGTKEPVQAACQYDVFKRRN